MGEGKEHPPTSPPTVPLAAPPPPPPVLSFRKGNFANRPVV